MACVQDILTLGWLNVILQLNFTEFDMFRAESEERAVGATYCASMKELLQRSDFVMVVVNLSPQTHKLIGAKEFAMMKPNSTFINISRGNVIGWSKAIQLNRSSHV